jgi:cbb3-type cytochrome oxidase subunit 3
LRQAHLHWAIGILAFGVASLGVTYFYMWRRWRKGGISQAKVTEVEKRDENVVSYIASYLIPFVSFPLDTFEHIAVLLIFVGVLFILYVNSNMIYINPMFNMIGFHLYEIRIESDQVSHYLIARQLIRPDRMLYYVEISDNVYLEKKVKKTI